MDDDGSHKDRSGAPVPEEYTGPGIMVWLLVGGAVFAAAVFLYHVGVATVEALFTVPIFTWLADAAAAAMKWLLSPFKG
ncbi:hypothetical protein ATN84_25485 [Paramesorhizobium deserti]|uniref:Uncharacterized protein n=1 Tax=Paramesorhizobium deserti TaxID=1494590 RepID=A0A135HVF6_9HYPH|nr:hypothetical protein ATN84_25485 [Paramesorhizobium deserti]